MPGPAVHPGQRKKKATGRIPAHQNTFAWKHNPKSKKTEQILNSRIEHVCRRCHDKLAWRKQYRKYKPLTQARKCNHCQKPASIFAAYHTICNDCTKHSPQCVALLHQWNNSTTAAAVTTDAAISMGQEGQDHLEAHNDNKDSEKLTVTEEAAQVDSDDDDEEDDEYDDEKKPENKIEGQISSETMPQQQEQDEEPRVFVRVCAMCVKEPALPASDDESSDDEENGAGGAAAGGKLRLRDIKRIQRQQEQQLKKKTKKKPQNNHNKKDDNGNSYIPQHEEEDEPSENENSDDDNEDVPVSKLDSLSFVEKLKLDVHDDDEEDPFLKAVGGADKLLTGEAYQRMLLQKLAAATTAPPQPNAPLFPRATTDEK